MKEMSKKVEFVWSKKVEGFIFDLGISYDGKIIAALSHLDYKDKFYLFDNEGRIIFENSYLNTSDKKGKGEVTYMDSVNISSDGEFGAIKYTEVKCKIQTHFPYMLSSEIKAELRSGFYIFTSKGIIDTIINTNPHVISMDVAIESKKIATYESRHCAIIYCEKNPSNIRNEKIDWDGIVMYDGVTGNVLWEYPIEEPHSVIISPNGKYVIAVSRCGKNVLFIEDGRVIFSKNIGEGKTEVIISSNSKYIVVRHNSQIYMFDTKGDILCKEYFHEDNKIVGFENENLLFYHVYDKKNGKFSIGMINKKGLSWKNDVEEPYLTFIKFSKENILVGTFWGRLYMFNKDGKLLWKVGLDDDLSADMDISKNGKYCVATTHGGGYHLYSTNGKLIWSIKKDKEISKKLFCDEDDFHEVYLSRISGNGKYLILTANNKIMCLKIIEK